MKVYNEAGLFDSLSLASINKDSLFESFFAAACFIQSNWQQWKKIANVIIKQETK